MPALSFIPALPLLPANTASPLSLRVPAPSATRAAALVCRSDQRTTREPSFPVVPPELVPPSLYSTTIYHNIPSNPEHHHSSVPLNHPSDGDGYILALSFPPSPPSPDIDDKPPPADPTLWLRGRFVRTKPFYVESRQQRRIFRGYFGTPGVTGLDAPVKPKPSCALGVTSYGSGSRARVVAYGIRALPFAMVADTLVSRGPTLLGSVLTEADELIGERGTELCAPLRLAPRADGDAGDGDGDGDGVEEVTLAVATSRAASGRVVGGFVVELDATSGKVTRRVARFPVAARAAVHDGAAARQWVAVLSRRAAEESGGLLAGVLGTGRAKAAPVIDTDFGVGITLVSRSDGNSVACNLPGVAATRAVAVLGPAEGVGKGAVVVRVVAVRAGGDNARDGVTRLSTLTDARCGKLWRRGGGKGITSEVLDVTVSVRGGDADGEGKLTAAVVSVQAVDLGARATACDVLDALPLRGGGRCARCATRRVECAGWRWWEARVRTLRGLSGCSKRRIGW